MSSIRDPSALQVGRALLAWYAARPNLADDAGFESKGRRDLAEIEESLDDVFISLDSLALMEVLSQLELELGVDVVEAVADEQIGGAADLIEWLGEHVEASRMAAFVARWDAHPTETSPT